MRRSKLTRRQEMTHGTHPIYDKSGTVVGWLRDLDLITLQGSYIAFVKGSNVITYSGRHLGWLEHGVFWDSQNHAIGMLRNVTASIPRPGLGGVPGRPGLGGRPGRPGTPGSPGKPGRSNSWSSVGWDRWLSATSSRRKDAPAI